MSNLIIISDLHGNFELYGKFKELWKDEIIFLGDVIDGSGNYPDNSIKILDDIKSEIKNPKFHVLTSNHQVAHYTDIVYDGGLLKNHFKKMVRKEHKGVLQPHYDKYVDLMKSFPLYYVTENNLFLSHAGPANDYWGTGTRYIHNKKIDFKSFVWNYLDEIPVESVEEFLRIHGFNNMVVGHNHTCFDYETLGGLLTFNSLNGWYLEIDTEKEMNLEYLISCMKKLN